MLENLERFLKMRFWIGRNGKKAIGMSLIVGIPTVKGITILETLLEVIPVAFTFRIERLAEVLDEEALRVNLLIHLHRHEVELG